MRQELTRSSMAALFAAAIGMGFGATPILSATTSLFIVPLSQDFGLSRGETAALMLIPPWTGALLASSAGGLIDRLGVRRVTIPALLVFIVGLFLLSRATYVWQVALFFLLVGIGTAGHAQSAYTKVVTLWFNKNRGLAIGLSVAVGTGLGAALMPQYAHLIIDRFGWRSAYAGLGGVVLLVALPILILVLREPPPALAGTRDSESEAAGLSFREAARTRAFWTLVPLLIITPFALSCTSTQLFPTLVERGMSGTSAASAVSAIYLGGMTGQILMGFLLDRCKTPRIVVSLFMCALLGVAIVAALDSVPLALLGSFLLGLCQGSELGVAAYMCGRYFGIRAFGAIYGLILGAATIGFGAGMVLAAFSRDAAGKYGSMTPLQLALLACSLGLAASLPRYPGSKSPKVADALITTRTPSDPAVERVT